MDDAHAIFLDDKWYLSDPTWLALGQSPPHRVFISTQGDFMDFIAIKAYGRRRGNEHLMYRLLEENYPLREVVEFPAGVSVIVPTIDVDTVTTLVPWKNAFRDPNSP